jgi:hypothetical protein
VSVDEVPAAAASGGPCRRGPTFTAAIIRRRRRTATWVLGTGFLGAGLGAIPKLANAPDLRGVVQEISASLLT